MWLKATTLVFALFFVGTFVIAPDQQVVEASSGLAQASVLADSGQRATLGDQSQQAATAEVVHRLTAACCGEGCNPGRTSSDYIRNHWDGWKYNNGGNQVGGVFANIWNYSPWVWPAGGTGGDFATAWTMLTTDHPYTTDAGYAQVGWLEWQGGSRVTFEEFHEYGGGHIDRYNDFPAYAVNTYTYYDTLYNPSTNTISFRVNGTNDNNFLNHPQTWRPAEGQVSGETLTLATQMPGGFSSTYAYEDLFDSEIYIGGWKRFPNPGAPGNNVSTFIADYYGNSDAAYFGQTTPSNGNISIYDKNCAN